MMAGETVAIHAGAAASLLEFYHILWGEHGAGLGGDCNTKVK